MRIEEAAAIGRKLEEILKEEEKLTALYFDLTIFADRVEAFKTAEDIRAIGETVGYHRDKTKKLIQRFKAEVTRISRVQAQEAQAGEFARIRGTKVAYSTKKVPGTPVRRGIYG